jgi:hypothetical protein
VSGFAKDAVEYETTAARLRFARVQVVACRVARVSCGQPRTASAALENALWRRAATLVANGPGTGLHPESEIARLSPRAEFNVIRGERATIPSGFRT